METDWQVKAVKYWLFIEKVNSTSRAERLQANAYDSEYLSAYEELNDLALSGNFAGVVEALLVTAPSVEHLQSLGRA